MPFAADAMLANAALYEASDGLAIAMVLLLGFALGMILTILIVMAHNAGKKPDVDPDGDEENNEPVQHSARKNSPPKSPWERDGDWWKDEGNDRG